MAIARILIDGGEHTLEPGRILRLAAVAPLEIRNARLRVVGGLELGLGPNPIEIYGCIIEQVQPGRVSFPPPPPDRTPGEPAHRTVSFCFFTSPEGLAENPRVLAAHARICTPGQDINAGARRWMQEVRRIMEV